MNNVKFRMPDGKLGGITIIRKVQQKQHSLKNGAQSIAKLNAVMLRRGYVRCGVRAV